MELLQELRTLILEHVGDGGRKATVVDGVAVAVVNEPTPPVVAPVPRPTLAIVAQAPCARCSTANRTSMVPANM